LDILFLYKTVCDLSVILSVAHMLAYIIGHRCNPFALLAVCAAAALACRSANARKPLRFAPLVLLLGCGFIVRDAADYIVAFIAGGYVVVTVAAGNFTVERDVFVSRFMTLIFGWLIIFLLALGMELIGYAPFSDTVAFAVIFFVAGIALLRATLHFEDTLKRTSFKLINLGVVLLVTAAGLALGSDVVTGNTLGVLYFIYRHTLYYLFYGVLWLFSKAFNFGAGTPPTGPEPSFTPEYVTENIPAPVFDDGLFWNNVGRFVIPAALVVFFGFFIYVIYRLIRWMLDKGGNKPMAYSGGRRETVNAAAKPPADTGARASVRRYYRRFLKLCRLSGIRVTAFMSSADVSDEADAVFGVTDKLRGVYIKARYGNDEVTGADVSNARSEYHRLRKRPPDGQLPPRRANKV
jgi:hypothetical protein